MSCGRTAHLEWENVPVNLKLFNKRIAAIEGANIIVLPEMFASGFTMKGKERVAPFYEAVYQCMQEWAREKDALIMGSTVYFEDEHYYNRLLVAFPDGKILHYDKKHLFTMGEEKEHFTAGNELLVFDYQGVRIAPFICYDLRFPCGVVTRVATTWPCTWLTGRRQGGNRGKFY